MAPDAHCHVAKAFYSVPWRLIGSELQVCVKENTVQFFKGEEIVKTHPRVPPGRRRTDLADLPEDRIAFFLRTPQWCLKRAGELGPHVKEAVAQVLSVNTLYNLRQAQGILRLEEKHGAKRLDAACERALVYGDPRYRTVKNILANEMDGRPIDVRQQDGSRSVGAFLHDQQYFALPAVEECSGQGERSMRSHFPDTSAGGRREGGLARGGPEGGAGGLASRALFVATAVPGTPPGNAEAREARGSAGRSGTVAVGHRRPAAGPGAHPASLRVPGCAGGESSYGHLDGDHTNAGDGLPGASGLFGVPGGGDRCERPDGEPGAFPRLVKHFWSLCGPPGYRCAARRAFRGHGAALQACRWVRSGTPGTPETQAGKQSTAGRLPPARRPVGKASAIGRVADSGRPATVGTAERHATRDCVPARSCFSTPNLSEETESMKVHQLEPKLKALRLGGMLESLEIRLEQAQRGELGYLTFLEMLLEDEITRRAQKALSRRLVRADFDEVKTLAEL